MRKTIYGKRSTPEDFLNALGDKITELEGGITSAHRAGDPFDDELDDSDEITLHAHYTLPEDVYMEILNLESEQSQYSDKISKAAQLVSEYDSHAFNIWQRNVGEVGSPAYQYKELTDLLVMKYEDMYGVPDITAATNVNTSTKRIIRATKKGSPQDFEEALHSRISELEGGVQSAEYVEGVFLDQNDAYNASTGQWDDYESEERGDNFEYKGFNVHRDCWDGDGETGPQAPQIYFEIYGPEGNDYTNEVNLSAYYDDNSITGYNFDIFKDDEVKRVIDELISNGYSYEEVCPNCHGGGCPDCIGLDDIDSSVKASSGGDIDHITEDDIQLWIDDELNALEDDDWEGLQDVIWACPDSVLEDDLQLMYDSCLHDGDFDDCVSSLDGIASDYIDNYITSSADINDKIQGPQTNEDLVGLATKYGLNYDYDEAGNLIVFDETYDLNLAGLEDGYGPNIDAFFDEASQNPSFHYEDYDGEFGVGFKGIRGIADVMGADTSNINYNVGDLFELTDTSHPYTFEILEITDEHVQIQNFTTGVTPSPISKDEFDSRWGSGYYTYTGNKDTAYGPIESSESIYGTGEGEVVLNNTNTDAEGILAADLLNDKDYVERLASETVDWVANFGYQAGYQIQPDENYLYFEVFDVDDVVIHEYLQSIADIEPIEADLFDDSRKLAEAIMEGIPGWEDNIANDEGLALDRSESGYDKFGMPFDGVESSQEIVADDYPVEDEFNSAVQRPKKFRKYEAFLDELTAIAFDCVDVDGLNFESTAVDWLSSELNNRDLAEKYVRRFIKENDMENSDTDYDIGTDHYGEPEIPYTPPNRYRY